MQVHTSTAGKYVTHLCTSRSFPIISLFDLSKEVGSPRFPARFSANFAHPARAPRFIESRTLPPCMCRSNLHQSRARVTARRTVLTILQLCRSTANIAIPPTHDITTLSPLYLRFVSILKKNEINTICRNEGTLRNDKIVGYNSRCSYA